MRFNVIDVPDRVKLPARSVCLIIPFLLELFIICICNEEIQKDSPTSSSLFFQSASAVLASTAYPRTPWLPAKPDFTTHSILLRTSIIDGSTLASLIATMRRSFCTGVNQASIAAPDLYMITRGGARPSKTRHILVLLGNLWFSR